MHIRHWIWVNSRLRLGHSGWRRALTFFFLVGCTLAGRASAATANVAVGGPSGQLVFIDSVSGTSTTTINAGDTVVWTWASGFHSTTSGTCSVSNNCTHTGFWDSGEVATPSSGTFTFSRTFNKPGTYPYFCTVHDNSMTGVLVVRAQFSGAVDYATGLHPFAVTLADVNNDGKLDAVTANHGANTVSVLLGNGNGAFAAKSDFLAGNAPTSVAIADFNHDGKLDLAVTDEADGTVSILLGNGNGTFQPPVSYTVGVRPQAVAVGDFNKDGNPDLAVTNAGSNNVSILLGNADGTFKPAVNYPVGNNPFFVVAADFNGDGSLDLAVSNVADNTVSILLGKGDGTFQNATSFPAGNSPQVIAAADLDGDGKLDLAVANSGAPSGVSVLRGNGDGTFQTAVLYPAGITAQGLAVVDLNRDGKPDIAVADSGSSNVHILLGNGAATFQAVPDLTIAPDSASYFIAAGDLNADGKADLVTANNANNSISVLLNQMPQPISGPATHLSVTAPTSVNAGSSFTVTVTALDDFENAATSYTGTIHFTASDGTAVLPANYTFVAGDKGVHSFTGVVLHNAQGFQTIAAADTVAAALRGSSSDITVTPGPASRYAVTYFSTITAGNAVNVTIIAQDAYGNTATGYTGAVHFSSTDPSAILPADYKFVSADNGTHSFSPVLKTAGAQTISMTDTVNINLSANANVMVNPGAAVKFSIPQSGTATVGAPAAITVTALDSFNNIATGYRGTIHFSSTDTAGVLPPDYTFTSTDNGAHTFQITFFTAGNQTVTATDTVAAPIIGTSGSFTVQPAGTTTVLTVGPPQSVFRETVTLTATVTSATSGVPKGSVRFRDVNAGIVLQTVPLISGQAVFSTSQWTIGKHTLRAAFVPADTNFSLSLSNFADHYHSPKPIERSRP